MRATDKNVVERRSRTEGGRKFDTHAPAIVERWDANSGAVVDRSDCVVSSTSAPATFSRNNALVRGGNESSATRIAIHFAVSGPCCHTSSGSVFTSPAKLDASSAGIACCVTPGPSTSATPSTRHTASCNALPCDRSAAFSSVTTFVAYTAASRVCQESG